MELDRRYHIDEQMANTKRKAEIDIHPLASGFPSPATEYQESSLDLNAQLIRHPAATFFFRFKGDDGERMGVRDGDLLVVDRAVTPSPDRLLLVERDGEWALSHGREAASKGPPLRVWGVVTWTIHEN